uniref:Replication factor A C-terminal domain-containing protein n=1 Tax=Brassica oleracea var. oleracea TaxID=109376 RepID=A0A0D3DNQ1_BRAOL
MNSNSQTPVFGDLTAKKPNGKDAISSAEPVRRVSKTRVSLSTADSDDAKSKKPNGKAVVSSADPVNRAGQTGVSLATAVSGDPKSKKPNGKAVVSSSNEMMFFKDVKFGPQEGEIRFRLIHFWEARNVHTKVLMGLEMLLIDEHGTVIQGFIPPSRIKIYLPKMIAGSIYRLINFYGSKSKTVYRVAEPDVIIAFSWNSVPLFSGTVLFSFLWIGSVSMVMKSLKRHVTSRGIFMIFSVTLNCGHVMKLYVWDKATTDFCEKFKALGKPPTVILVTTLNPKRVGGALSLSSLSSSRVFFDMDVQATREYLAWYESNMDVANRVNAEIVTKTETATIGELLSYMKQKQAKVAWFECSATIDDVMSGSAWYYIACGGCKTKATKRPTTLMCKKCGKTEIDGAAEYLTKLSVYDNNDHASFVLLGDAGFDLTGKKASTLVESYFEANESVGDDHVVPVPQALIDTIGQTRTFVIKISQHNMDGKTQALTVTKVLSPEVPAPEGIIEENVDEVPVEERGESADETVKRSSDVIESGETKGAKCG